MYKAIYFLLSFLFLTAAHSESAFCPPVSVLVKKDPAGFVKSTRMLYAIDSRGLSPTLKGAAMQSLLTGVHPLLGDPRKECIAKLDDYELQILPEITDDMLFDLMAIIPSDNRHGFGILSSPFWSSVQKVQRSGIKVGWILRSPYPVNGVYLGSHDVIGLNPAADIPTLAHEFRHYAQAHYFDYQSNKRFC